MITINDSRTIVTEVFLEESKYADGTKKYFVAYREKGYSGSRLVNGGTGYSYTSLRQVDEDHIEALAENGDWHIYTIGTNGVWSGPQRGFTETSKSLGNNENDDDDDRSAKADRKKAKEKKHGKGARP